MRLSAIIQKENEWFIAINPETGTTTQGKSFDEALSNLREATELYLEEFSIPEPEPSILTTFDAKGNSARFYGHP